jgi:hypothetical protein
VNPDLIQRALMHYAEHLETAKDDGLDLIEQHAQCLEAIACFLWPEEGARRFRGTPGDAAYAIMEELKRRGLGNGKVGE